MFNAFDRMCAIPGLREISLYHYRPGGQQNITLYHKGERALEGVNFAFDGLCNT